jgi:hypothetical protein
MERGIGLAPCSWRVGYRLVTQLKGRYLKSEMNPYLVNAAKGHGGILARNLGYFLKISLLDRPFPRPFHRSYASRRRLRIM